MFLRQSDFKNLIIQDHLNQVIANDPRILDMSMSEAQSEIENYLRGMFDLSLIFVEYPDYKPALTYEAGVYVWYAVTETIDGESVETEKIFKSKVAVSAGQAPDNAEVWEENDPRFPQIKQFYKDVTLYHVHSGIAPSNIPELRVLRYKDATKTLDMIKNNKLYTNLPKLESPNYGRTVVSQERNTWMF